MQGPHFRPKFPCQGHTVYQLFLRHPADDRKHMCGPSPSKASNVTLSPSRPRTFDWLLVVWVGLVITLDEEQMLQRPMQHHGHNPVWCIPGSQSAAPRPSRWTDHSGCLRLVSSSCHCALSGSHIIMNIKVREAFAQQGLVSVTCKFKNHQLVMLHNLKHPLH